MIQRWTMLHVPKDGGYAMRDNIGIWVEYEDHRKIVDGLYDKWTDIDALMLAYKYIAQHQEEVARTVLEASEALLNDVRQRHPEIEAEGFNCPYMRALEKATKKARER